MVRTLICGAMILTAVAAQASAWWPEPSSPERWEETIREFEEQDRNAPPAPGGVLFVGSSSIRLWKLDEAFPALAALNRGFGGSEVADALHFAERIILPYRPRAIVFYAGDNDIANGKSAERVRDDVRRLYEKIHAALPETRLLFLAIKPSRARWEMIETQRAANAMIAALAAEEEKLEFVDVATSLLGEDGKPRDELFLEDGLHLNAEGYAVWNGVLMEVMSDE